MTDVSTSDTTVLKLAVGLRGKLSADYLRMHNADPELASKWIRRLVFDATQGHRQLLTRMEGEKMIIGLKSEVGKYGDW